MVIIEVFKSIFALIAGKVFLPNDDQINYRSVSLMNTFIIVKPLLN